jgi:D-glycero-D-manno-heptose 1,7-bisphosphate phosphatase
MVTGSKSGRKAQHECGKRAVFMDRDGVLIKEVNYLSRLEDMELIPGAAKSIAKLREAGFTVIVISNQSAVARGLLSLSRLAKITRVLRAELLNKNSAARLDAVYYCPHHPEFGSSCACRKPGIALILKAQKRFKLDLTSSYFIGDTSADILTATNAGCVPVLVKTGQGGRDGLHKAKPKKICKDILDAAKWILSDAQ